MQTGIYSVFPSQRSNRAAAARLWLYYRELRQDKSHLRLYLYLIIPAAVMLQNGLSRYTWLLGKFLTSEVKYWFVYCISNTCRWDLTRHIALDIYTCTCTSSVAEFVLLFQVLGNIFLKKCTARTWCQGRVISVEFWTSFFCCVKVFLWKVFSLKVLQYFIGGLCLTGQGQGYNVVIFVYVLVIWHVENT